MNEIIKDMSKGLIEACKGSYNNAMTDGIPFTRKSLKSIEEASKVYEKILSSTNPQDKEYLMLQEMINYNKRFYILLNCVLVNMEQTAALNKALIENLSEIMKEEE